ncbi:alkylphosphonate utilization protein [Aquimarina sp. RZ0]|uniref:PhnA domain-containing protein n=1 Tax=Aquimarina sp. RZ0 TaxID=2607730 RepID=UPI0011F2E60A|nr:alkylphosphonate utilization protein [Aquimarina sp. RZ0]KAA1245463.1 PhnA protein [Aquimarina sp. RZ0]
MSKLKELQDRSETTCELCNATDNLSIYDVPESPNVGLDSSILICSTCKEQIEDVSIINPNHWRCLNDSMWSQVPGVQVIAYRMLNRLKSEAWPQDLLDMLYLDDDTLAWAKATGDGDHDSAKIKHLDSNGALLQAGDSIVLIKDLNVKGANFTAKRGTAVRNISLVHDNPEHIEGKINGQHIVILTKYTKKSN